MLDKLAYFLARKKFNQLANLVLYISTGWLWRGIKGEVGGFSLDDEI